MFFSFQKTYQSFEVLAKYARVLPIEVYQQKVRTICDNIWLDGKQQCEYLSLRGNPCAMPKHIKDDEDPSQVEHSSGVVYISTCNCGRTQGRRDDPYTIRQANYDFYQLLAISCSACSKLEKINFAVFEPSINDFRAAELDVKLSSSTVIHSTSDNLELSQQFMKHAFLSQTSPVLTASQVSETNLSLNTIDDEEEDDLNKDHNYDASDDDSVNEIVIKVGETEENSEKFMMRQPSTTEYLPGMVHTLSPQGLLPQFPSWSLVCIGPSSVYSHNTGLPEHVQSGFLSGANFLLPWDVHVRLEHAASWAASYEKSRSRKKPQQQIVADANIGQVFVLKIFIGCEYECPRGHRFIMNTPDKVLRGGSGKLHIASTFR